MDSLDFIHPKVRIVISKTGVKIGALAKEIPFYSISSLVEFLPNTTSGRLSVGGRLTVGDVKRGVTVIELSNKFGRSGSISTENDKLATIIDPHFNNSGMLPFAEMEEFFQSTGNFVYQGDSIDQLESFTSAVRNKNFEPRMEHWLRFIELSNVIIEEILSVGAHNFFAEDKLKHPLQTKMYRLFSSTPGFIFEKRPGVQGSSEGTTIASIYAERPQGWVSGKHTITELQRKILHVCSDASKILADEAFITDSDIIGSKDPETGAIGNLVKSAFAMISQIYIPMDENFDHPFGDYCFTTPYSVASRALSNGANVDEIVDKLLRILACRDLFLWLLRAHKNGEFSSCLVISGRLLRDLHDDFWDFEHQHLLNNFIDQAMAGKPWTELIAVILEIRVLSLKALGKPKEAFLDASLCLDIIFSDTLASHIGCAHEIYFRLCNFLLNIDGLPVDCLTDEELLKRSQQMAWLILESRGVRVPRPVNSSEEFSTRDQFINFHQSWVKKRLGEVRTDSVSVAFSALAGGLVFDTFVEEDGGLSRVGYTDSQEYNPKEFR